MPATTSKNHFARIPTEMGTNRELSVEYRWINSELKDSPTAVFLHEGLGSMDMWGNWPETLCNRLNFRGLVYSRPGYGQSTPYSYGRHWPFDYHVEQTCNILPRMLNAVGLTETERKRMWVVGHSDGATIALLYAATFPSAVGHVVSIAPHVFVEDVTISGVIAAGLAYKTSTLRARLSRYHADVDTVFYGWHDTWSSQAFKEHWSIVDQLASIRTPLLLVQGTDDSYGTMSQIHAISSVMPDAKILTIPNCNHSPHREEAHILTEAIARFSSVSER